MCGRFVSSSGPAAIADFFGASVDTEELPQSWNVAPTNEVYGVVAEADGSRHVHAYRWGLIPSWAKDAKIASSLINARSETAAEKPSFRSSFRRHRLLIPMDGFYEWRAVTGPSGRPVKQPVFVHSVDGTPLAVAGLWSAWREPGSAPDTPWRYTCTVLTTAANLTMSVVHDRMPVLLPAARWSVWLDPSCTDTELLRSLLLPADDGLLVLHEVSTAVNSVRNKGRELIDPIDR